MAKLTHLPAHFLSATSLKRAFIALSIVVLAGCTDDDRHDYQYTANVTRTEYGIPHISADNWVVSASVTVMPTPRTTSVW